MPADSAVRKSSQGWKLVAGLAGTFAGGFLLFLIGLPQENALAAIGGIVLGLGSFFAMCLSIHCPRCGARWMWIAVSKQQHLGLWNWLCAQKVCPKCGYDPGTGRYAPHHPTAPAMSRTEGWPLGKLVLTTIGLFLAGVITAVGTYTVLQKLRLLDNDDVARLALPLAFSGPAILFGWWRSRKRKVTYSGASDSVASPTKLPPNAPPQK